jgi:starch synthase
MPDEKKPRKRTAAKPVAPRTKRTTATSTTEPAPSIPEILKAGPPEPAAEPVALEPPAPKKRAARRPAAKKTAATSTATAPNISIGVPEVLSVLMVTPEAHPFAKTGGLAEVSASLTDALAKLGHAVTLVLPRYRGVAVDGAEHLQTRLRMGDRLQPVAYYERRLSERVTLVLVDIPEFFDREGLYGTSDGDYADNALRYAVFSRAALEYPRLREQRPSVIHAHDWQSGLVPVYQKMQLSSDPYVGGVPAIFTIHNLAFQGVFPASTLSGIGLGFEVLDVQGLEFWGNISYLKGGINFSEKITTVSPGYAREIVQPELGFGFEGVLARRSADLVGILNGIDTSRWTPTADPFVKASFSADDLGGKRDAKRALLSVAGLPSDDAALARPLVGLVSRMTDQKGFDLIGASVTELMSLDAAWVMLGTGERRYQDQWRALAARYPERVSTTIGFDERLAHHIEAGADMFLMPSRFEPCGLNQLYSLRYGTVPIVRATGGLNDTVEDVVAGESGTGFKFRDYTPEALVSTVRRALSAYRNPAGWAAIEQRGMRQDHSWDASAAEYVKLYRAMLNADF